MENPKPQDKPESEATLPAPTGSALIDAILAGIDKEETDATNGWWETSTGAEFGAQKLNEIRALFAIPEKNSTRDGKMDGDKIQRAVLLH